MMDKKGFGQLVATLRKECRNEFDEIMSQYDLAELCKIPLITLQKIEQGRQANIKSDVLLALARALNLPSRARQVFFLASLGMKDNQFIKPSSTPLEKLDELTNTLSQLQSPAFISDGFGDILVTNPSFPAIYAIKAEQLEAPHLLSQHNLNRLLFAPEFETQRQMMGDTLHDFARHAVLQYKIITLNYRNHWYFQRLLPELNRYPIFRSYWQSPTFQDEDIFIQYNHLTLHHAEFGQLKFLFSSLSAITSSGDLHLNSFQPVDAHSAQVCVQLTRRLGTRLMHISPWPKTSPNATLLGEDDNF
jgi:transcriptional regulator with XRE-family HTH domain